MNCGNKKLLLTGATGLIGKELIEPLKQLNFDIYAITTRNNHSNNDINWLKGNLFDTHNIKEIIEEVKPKYLLNMAWATTDDYLTSDINYDFLNAGINLLKYFKDNGGKRAVFAGTCFEYKFKNEPLKEFDELDTNKTVYSFCKNKLHEIAEYFCYINNISFGYGRIFYVFGRNENKNRLAGMIIDKLLHDEQVIIKSGCLLKDYMYSKDIAGAFAKFLDSEVEGTVNICTGSAISVHDFAIEIGKTLNKENLIIFKDESSNQPPIIVGDNTRLMKEVKYDIKYSLQEAIDDILQEATF